jgi:hypothetical protein
MMKRALKVWIFAFLLGAVFCPVTGTEAAGGDSALIGSPTINFSLASTNGRLINYGQEYYGKSNVIITFFPAAFTPV